MNWYIEKEDWKIIPENGEISQYKFYYKGLYRFNINGTICYENTEIVMSLLDILNKYKLTICKLKNDFSFNKKKLYDKYGIEIYNSDSKKLHSFWDNNKKLYWNFNNKSWILN